MHLPEAIQRRAASDNPSTDSLFTRSTIVHLLFLDFPFFSTTPLVSTNPPQSVFSPSVVCGG